MSENCHSILKAYCALIGKTMSEVLYDWARKELHYQSVVCNAVTQMMGNHQCKLDARVHKPCWGYRCNLCQHETACRVGKENKLFIIDPKWHNILKPDSDYIKEFDGSCIDCCSLDQVYNKLNDKSE